jgi:murein DD-endopeptidase MepM/ murein hydrolase activator NlpD
MSRTTAPGAPPRSRKETIHLLEPGESIEKVSQRYGLGIDTVRAANLEANRNHRHLPIGTPIVIPIDKPSKAVLKHKLSTQNDQSFTKTQLLPVVKAACAAHKPSPDPKVVLGIIMQESSMRNLLVHRDGTGTGLCGIDAHGEMKSFFQWSKLDEKKYRKSASSPQLKRVFPPELQIEFLCKRLSEMMAIHDCDTWGAVPVWHTFANPDEAAKYLKAIRARVAAL